MEAEPERESGKDSRQRRMTDEGFPLAGRRAPIVYNLCVRTVCYTCTVLRQGEKGPERERVGRRSGTKRRPQRDSACHPLSLLPHLYLSASAPTHRNMFSTTLARVAPALRTAAVARSTLEAGERERARCTFVIFQLKKGGKRRGPVAVEAHVACGL